MPDPLDVQGQEHGETTTNAQGFLAVRHTFLTYVETTPELRSSRSDSDLASLHANRSIDSSVSSPRAGSSRGTIERLEASSDSIESSRSDDTGSLPYTMASGGVTTAADTNDTWSRGSAKHGTGQCRPCLYVQSSAGCVRGSSCAFCHLEHPQLPRQRPCKATRTHFKRLVGMLESGNGYERVVAEDLTQHFARQHSYMRVVLKAHANTKNSGSSSSGSSFGDEALSASRNNRGSPLVYNDRDRRNHLGYSGQEDPHRAYGNQSTSSDQADYHRGYADHTWNESEKSGQDDPYRHHANIPPPLQPVLSTVPSSQRPTKIRL